MSAIVGVISSMILFGLAAIIIVAVVLKSLAVIYEDWRVFGTLALIWLMAWLVFFPPWS